MTKNTLSSLFLIFSFYLSAHAEDSIKWKENREILRLSTNLSPKGKGTVPLSSLSPALQKQVRTLVANYDIYLLERLSKEEKWNSVFALFSPSFSSSPNIPQDKITHTHKEYVELNITTKRPIETVFGWVSLPLVESHALANPEKHRALLQSLAQDPHLLQELELLLKKVKRYENAILSLWREEPIEIKRVVDSLYSKKNSRVFHRNYSPTWQYLFSYLRLAPLTPEETTGIILASLFHSATGIYCMPPADMRHFNHYRALLNYLHTRTNSIARVVEVLDAELKALPQHPDLRFLSHASALNMIKNQPNAKAGSLNQLVALLKTNTFKKSPSSFYRHAGNIRVAHFLMTHLKNELIPLLMALGELDVYLSYAKTYRKNHAPHFTEGTTIKPFTNKKSI
jgi:hypothetical protein